MNEYTRLDISFKTEMDNIYIAVRKNGANVATNLLYI